MSLAFDANRWRPASLLPRSDGRDLALLFVVAYAITAPSAVTISRNSDAAVVSTAAPARMICALQRL